MGGSFRGALSTSLGMIVVLSGVGVQPVEDQYFGRNQVQYENFDFEILQTEHFNIYFYEEEREASEQAGILAERWPAQGTGLAAGTAIARSRAFAMPTKTRPVAGWSR